MKHPRDVAELLRRLDAGEIVPVTADQWHNWCDGFDLVREVPTALGKAIGVVRWPPGKRTRRWGIVEQPATGERVVRPLADGAAVKALIADRLAAYERMWDG